MLAEKVSRYFKSKKCQDRSLHSKTSLSKDKNPLMPGLRFVGCYFNLKNEEKRQK